MLLHLYHQIKLVVYETQKSIVKPKEKINVTVIVVPSEIVLSI